MASSILQQILARLPGTERPVVVFDVDSTLIDTRYRHHGILADFAATHGSPGLRAVAATLHPDAFGWTVREPLEGRVPDDELDALDRFWAERFFASDYLHLDRPVAGAVDFVREVTQAGAVAYLLTARDAGRMGEGTLRSLHALGFPLLEGRLVLHLKPDASVRDHTFKRQALDRAASAGQVVATFENEPANANLFADAFPDATHVLIDTHHSPGAPPPAPQVLRIPDFR